MTTTGDVTTLTLDGHIDEDVKTGLGAAIAKVATVKVTIDCERVKKINSIGVRDWIQVILKQAAKLQITFVNCPEPFIDMAVMVPPFVGSATIASFYASYSCNGCGREQRVLLRRQGDALEAPQLAACAKCGGQLEADDELKHVVEALKEGA